MAEISYGNIPEISTSNTPKSPDFQGKSRFLMDITLPEISIVEISGGNKKKKKKSKSWDREGAFCTSIRYHSSKFAPVAPVEVGAYIHFSKENANMPSFSISFDK